MSGPFPVFPTNPSIGDTFTDSNGGEWTYGSTGWTKTVILLNNTYHIKDISDATIPPGGTPGQFLRKSSGTDYDAGWASLTDVFVLACSDESTALTTGTNKVRFRMPYAGTLTAVRATVNTAPTGAALVVDINEAGSSVLSTKLSIDASETSSTTAATPAVISDSSLADDAEISIDIDQIGSTVAGAGLKVALYVTRS